MLILKQSQDAAFYNNKLKYVIKVFNENYITSKPIYIGYGAGNDLDIKLPDSDAVLYFSGNEPVPAEVNIIDWQNKKIIALFSNGKNAGIFSIQDDTVNFNFDILYTIFYFISCWQELKSDERDEIGRYTQKYSLISKHEFVQTPIVNYYLDILNTAIEKLTAKKSAVNKRIPGSFGVAVTHDIDNCFTGWKENFAFNIKKLKFLKAGRHLFNKVINQDVWFNIDEILEIERRLNVKSNFFFIPTKKPFKNVPNADYDLASKKFAGVLENIQAESSQIGLHNSYGAGFDYKMFQDDVSKFPIKVNGGRFHYLAYDIRESFEYISKSGMDYDTSMGFAESIGFRNGYCKAFKPYDIENDCEHSFYEFPVAVMDTTLINKKYMGSSPEFAFDAIKKIILEIKKFNGIFVFIWHNTSFSGDKYFPWGKLFTDIIYYCKEQNASFNTIEEYVDLYKT